MARRNIAEVLTGAAVLLVAGGFLVYAVANSGRASAPGYPLKASFLAIDGLGVGSDVRVAGVKVGSVTEARIDPKTYQADVTLTVQEAIRLPRDSSASVTSDGLLGGKYLSLVPGADEEMLAAGGRISNTQSSVNLEELLGKFVFSAANLSGAAKPPAGK